MSTKAKAGIPCGPGQQRCAANSAYDKRTAFVPTVAHLRASALSYLRYSGHEASFDAGNFFLLGLVAAFASVSAHSFDSLKARSRTILALRASCSLSYSRLACAMSRWRSAFKAAAAKTSFVIARSCSCPAYVSPRPISQARGSHYRQLCHYIRGQRARFTARRIKALADSLPRSCRYVGPRRDRKRLSAPR